MAKKRPSYPQLRSRQRYLLEYTYSTGRDYKQAAKDFGVTPRQFEQFVTTKPKTLRRNFNRSPVYDKLFTAGTEKNIKTATRERGARLERIGYREASIDAYRKMPGLDPNEVDRRVKYGEAIQNLYVENTLPRHIWAAYASRKNIPVSVKALKLLWRNRRIDDDKYVETIMVWKQIYHIPDRIADQYLPEDYGDE